MKNPNAPLRTEPPSGGNHAAARYRSVPLLAAGTLLLSLLLSGCDLLGILPIVPPSCTEQVPFEEIALNGTYTGTVVPVESDDEAPDETPVDLTVSPTWMSPQEYTITGNFTDPEGRRLTLEGTVEIIGCYESQPPASLQGQLSPPPPPTNKVTATATDGEVVVWRLSPRDFYPYPSPDYGHENLRLGFSALLEHATDGTAYTIYVELETR